MSEVYLTKEPLEIPQYLAKLNQPQFGGVVTFTGLVREWTGSQQTLHISFSAYEEMALKELEKLAVEVESWGTKVLIAHRLGELEVGDEVVFIGVACPHRKEAFKGCEYLIDTIKEKVPIWKKEINTTNEKWGGTKDERS